MSQHLLNTIETLSRDLTARADELNELDAIMGDGEHGSNIRKCFGQVQERLPLWKDLPPAKMLETMGMTLLSAGGGTATTLMGFGLVKIATPLASESEWTPQVLAAAARTALESMKARSQAVPGDKTLMDALVPAVDAFDTQAADGASLAVCLHHAAEAARTGAEATKAMLARRGRGFYVGERGLGVADPGAVSIATIVTSLARCHA